MIIRESQNLLNKRREQEPWHFSTQISQIPQIQAQSAYPTNPLVIIFYNQNQENPLCQRQGAKAFCRLWGDGL